MLTVRPLRRGRYVIGGTVILCVVGSWTAAAAQPWRVVNFDPSLRVTDINNDLVAVGLTVDDVPFVLRGTELRVFPALRGLTSLRINNNGLIAAGDSVRPRVIRATLSGSAFDQLDLSSPAQTFVTGLTDSGIVLFETTLSALRGGSDHLWAGTQLIELPSGVGLDAEATVSDVGEDGTIGGMQDGRPYLLHQGQPLQRPFEGHGSVSHIGPGGHVLGGTTVAGLVLRTPAGSIQSFSDCNPRFVGQLNRAGEFVVACPAFPGGRFEGQAFLNGELQNLNRYFDAPGEYVSFAARITDGGVILASVARESNPSTFNFVRSVLLVPPASEMPSTPHAAVNGRTVTVSWGAARLGLEYIVEAGSAPGLSDFFRGSVGAQLSIAGSVPPGRYFVRVRARTAFGLSAPTSEIEIFVP